LAPILADRILNQEISEQMTALWAGAVTRHEDDLANLTSQESGELNRMLHVAMPSSETIRATDWGAVVEFSTATGTNQNLPKQMGVDVDYFLGEELKIETRRQSQVHTMLHQNWSCV